LLLITAFLLVSIPAFTQEPPLLKPDQPDSDSLLISLDTLLIIQDSTFHSSDSLRADTIKDKKKPLLEAEITYASEDSLIFSIGKQKVYLFDKGVVNYQDIGLSGDYIEFDYSTKVAMAAGAIDSSGKLGPKPLFTQGEEKIEFDTMRYNFDTRKAKIKSIITQQGDGYLHSTQTKRLSDGEIHLKRGKYTTCDAPEPHFYIALTKAISIPGKRTVSGPGYLVFEDIPMPLGLPFGFFPNTNKRASGFIIPEFRDEQTRGFGLEKGGWYFAFNDYLDISLTGSVYSRGTWGVMAVSQYLVKYRYSGSFRSEYYNFRINDDPLTKDTRDFKILWSHSQDAKANPTRTFRASVDFATRSFEQRQGTNFSNILTNQKNSSISYSKRWPGRPFNFSANLTGNQSTKTGTVNLTLPSMNFNMERIYPLRGKDDDGDFNWFQNISVSYSSKFVNRINNIADSVLFTKEALDKMETGFAHSIPISLANIKVLDYINIVPSVSYSGVVFPYYIKKRLATDTTIFSGGREIIDTIHKVTYAQSFSVNLSISASPKLYGMYESKKEDSRIIAVRHVLSPKASMSFAPDMKGLVPDYYRTLPSVASAVRPVRYSKYSVYEGHMNGTPTVNGRSGSVSLGLGNNLEMKVRSDKDSTGEGRKVVILDNLDFSTRYSPFSPANKWSPVNMTGRSSLFKRKLNIQFSSSFDPYALDSVGRVSDKYLFSETGKIFRMTRAQVSLGFRLQSSSGKKKESTAPESDIEESSEVVPDEMSDMYNETGGTIRNDYVDFDIPWSVNIDYSWNYSKPSFKKKIDSSVRLSGDISLTPKWKFGVNTSYDFIAKEFSATNMSIHRDLHCWEMRFTIVPFGDYKSYAFTIRAKAAILRDLKWDKRQTWHDNF
jgi:hypothetical protein